MSEATVKREALLKIRDLILQKEFAQAAIIVSLFKANLKFSNVDELTFYAKLLMEIGEQKTAQQYLDAAIDKALNGQMTNALESLFWHLRTRSDLRFSRAGVALSYVLSLSDVSTVLDVGSGGGEHALEFANSGRTVHCIDFGKSIYVRQSEVIGSLNENARITTTVGDFMQIEPKRSYDLVWCSHVLEHQVNPNLFLKKCLDHLSDFGWLAITVPPLKHQIVGGHVTLWNAGLLLYQLVLAGNDCSQAIVMNYEYNISVIVRKMPVVLPDLDFDSGDIDRLKAFLPEGCTETFDGRMFGHAITNVEDSPLG